MSVLPVKMRDLPRRRQPSYHGVHAWPLRCGARAVETVRRVVAGALHALLTAPRVGPAAHRIYDWLTYPRVDTPRLRNPGQLDDKLLRGAQPTPSGFAALKARGVDTVVNLRPESDWEEPVVLACGMAYHKVPVSVMGYPTREQALSFLDVACDPATGLVFVHCFHGSDRTGAMGAVYRIARDGWSVEDACAEMRRYGFHDGYQDPKLRFVEDFAAYWRELPPDRRDTLVHRDPGGEAHVAAFDAGPFFGH